MGTDYGHGQTNIDHATGIRYGVISQNSILQAWADNSEAVYPGFDPDDDYEFGGCEPSGFEYRGDGYEMTDCLDSDVMVLKSPFFTFAPFCSPCVPGAGNLDDAAHYQAPLPGEHPIFPQVYAVGHDWFDDGVAPYPVFSVLTGRECFPDNWYGHGISIADGQRYPLWYGWELLTMPAGAEPSDYCA